MGRKRKSGRAYRAPSKTPWDYMPDHVMSAAEEMVAASHRSIYDFRHESYDGDVEFLNSYEREACPRCGSADIRRNGHDRRGLQRYLCGRCGRASAPATGTIFEDRKLPVAAWTDFLLQMLSHSSLAASTREDRRSGTTNPWWLAKTFLVLAGIQDGAALSGRVHVDETYWPVAEADAARGPGGRLLRGLSRNQLCIGVGCCDVRLPDPQTGQERAMRISVYQWEGFGKPSKARTWEAFGSRIEPGSTLVHDMEKSHGVLVERLGLVDESHNARLLRGVPAEDNPLTPVNEQCALLKHFLGAHPGFRRDRLQGYLDLFHVATNPPAEKMRKVAIILDRAMHIPVSLRYREFYNVGAGGSSE